MKKVMVFGTFDGIHPGHEFLFSEAKRLGNFLVVVVGRDETVAKLKGQPPRKSEQQRLKELMLSPSIDKAVLGYPDDYYRIIKEEQPAIICIGYDQTLIPVNEDMLRRKGIDAQIITVPAFKPEVYKSSKLNKKR